MNKLPRKYKLYISFMLIGIVLLAFLPSSCTCNCSSNDGVGGDWNPNALGIQSLEKLFISYRDGRHEIIIMDSDGSNQFSLVDNSAWDQSPACSPDGTKIAFTSYHDGVFDIHLIIADGSQVNLTDNAMENRYPAWSPDGTKIAYASQPDDTDPIFVTMIPLDIYVMHADGANKIRLTENHADSILPKWSPDGTKIAYIQHNISSDEIHVMDANGSNQVSLIHTPYRIGANDHAWSPDSTKIVYVSGFSGSSYTGGSEIHVVNADGSDNNMLIGGDDFYKLKKPVWSPDGNRIAFIGYIEQFQQSDLYVMNADGSNQINLTNTNVNVQSPVWSLDSTKIALVSKNDIYTIDVASKELIRLTTDANVVELIK